ncbi:aldo/keto reductase [Streptomyces triticirhizae]|uniref:Aldo/keto reductase n=1 Tax=Streptomyces triticirhizae TaxID=2483353 RepID=A0A3M2LRL9_9ACTN|nr:aldo/keto reductase [Streptomyces triticirhizae]RMI40089.1 aldo/keto reductase [Streptomyces triticirhizae]
MAAIRLALGTMHFGTTVPEATAFDLLDRYLDAGGSWLDTADCYSFWADPTGHGGASETVIGRWLARRPGARERVLLSTKVGAEPGDAGEWPANRRGLAARAVAEAVAGSLRRLGTDRIDLYWAHMEDRSVELAETVGAFADLVAAGTVARLGASNHALWRVERARNAAARRGWPGYTALQLRHSYLRPRPGAPVPDQGHRFGWVTEETLDYVASDPELTLWAYTTLLGGHYTRPERTLAEAYHHPGNDRRSAALARVADELGVSANQVVLAWLTGGTPPITPIVGVSRPEQLDEALAGAALGLPAEHRALLDEAA